MYFVSPETLEVAASPNRGGGAFSLHIGRFGPYQLQVAGLRGQTESQISDLERGSSRRAPIRGTP